MPGVRETRLIQLVADYGPGDLAFAETVQWLALPAPDSRVCATRGAAGDTLAAGPFGAGTRREAVRATRDGLVMGGMGRCRGPGRLADGRGGVAGGELVLEPGARGLKRLRLGGGSAAERFDDPPAGTPVEVTSAD